jgi:5-methylcytosine-specific restriction protein A
MNDWSHNLKIDLEKVFLLPFDVSRQIIDGEEHYRCSPHNEGDSLFSVEVFLHNQIRLLVEILPQKFGRGVLNDMSQAAEEKKQCFFDYIQMLRNIGAKIQFKVNDEEIENNSTWPGIWRSFSCKIIKVPVDISSDSDEYHIISEWMQHGVSLILSLLTVDDDNEITNIVNIHEEGAKYQILSTRYERNPINRKLCLFRKGYNCSVCGTNLFEKYGDIGKDFIEVHHTTPVSMMGNHYQLNIDKDLFPLCPNCHAMIHRKYPPYSIAELTEIWEEQNLGSGLIAAESFLSYNASHNLIVGVVKKEKISDFESGKANLYYFGKKFPSKYNIKDIQYFAPYYDGGIRGYYDVKAVRSARKSEILNQSDSFDNDIRILLELGEYHKLNNTPRRISLASHTYAFISLDELLRQ